MDDNDDDDEVGEMQVPVRKKKMQENATKNGKKKIEEK